MRYRIETHRLSKAYGDFVAVNEISLHVPQGKVYGFLGPNGAGKSTTMKMLLGLIRLAHKDTRRIARIFCGKPAL